MHTRPGNHAMGSAIGLLCLSMAMDACHTGWSRGKGMQGPTTQPFFRVWGVMELLNRRSRTGTEYGVARHPSPSTPLLLELRGPAGVQLCTCEYEYGVHSMRTKRLDPRWPRPERAVWHVPSGEAIVKGGCLADRSATRLW